MIYREMWTDRVQELLDILRDAPGKTLGSSAGDINVGGILYLLHNESVDSARRESLKSFLVNVPGFNEVESNKGMYHYTFIEQLEHICTCFRVAYFQKLIK